MLCKLLKPAQHFSVLPVVPGLFFIFFYLSDELFHTIEFHFVTEFCQKLHGDKHIIDIAAERVDIHFNAAVAALEGVSEVSVSTVAEVETDQGRQKTGV